MTNLNKLRALVLAVIAIIFFSAFGVFGKVLFYLAWSFIGIIITAVWLFKSIMNAIDEDEVYDALSSMTWKSFAILMHDVEKAHDGKWTRRKILSVEMHLANLLSERLVEMRENPITRQHHLNRNRPPTVEFRRVNSGDKPRRRKRVPAFRELIPIRTLG